MVNIQNSTNSTCIRCFDLGGSGLKTALLSYDKSTKEMKIISEQIQLGRCPTDKKVAEWARGQMKTLAHVDLDAEVTKGYLFGFSMAGLDKLRKKPVKTGDMSKLFNLPSKKVGSIDDGSAHLLASIKTLKDLPKGRIWNFSVGTGVGFGFTNSNHDVCSTDKLKKFFGDTNSWDLKEPTTKKAVWEACGSKDGFDKIVTNITKTANDEAFKIFAKRWKAFIETQIIKRSKTFKHKWGNPSAVVFTGGHIEHHGDRLIKELNKRGLKVKAFEGPKNAGLHGAAWNVLLHTKQ
jgi:hypothetical protein